MAGIKLKNIHKTYQVNGRAFPVLNGIDLEIPAGKITVILGQSGCGKTHICTALVGGFIKLGFSVRYLVWQEDSARLKAAILDGSYATELLPYKEADVLYLDDLFKTKSGFLQDVSNADVKLAFELLDYRCRNRMLTILSTEWTTAQLVEVDEALAGRIIRMARGYTICVKKDRNKNYRLKGADG